MVSTTEAARESRARRSATRQGFGLHKDRHRPSRDVNHQGGFMIVRVDTNYIEVGERFDLRLDDVEAWLAEDAPQAAST